MTAVEVPQEVVEVVKIGNLTADPILRYGQNGQAIVEVNMAVNPPHGQEGEAQFYKLVMFRSIAENAAESLEKSMRVIVVGRPDVDVWTDKDSGEEKTKKKIIVTAIGPDLRFATAEVTKIYRATPRPVAVVDPSNF